MLTWKYFRIFTKIAYGVYLIQFPVFFYNVGVTRHSGEYRSILMVKNGFVDDSRLISVFFTAAFTGDSFNCYFGYLYEFNS